MIILNIKAINQFYLSLGQKLPPWYKLLMRLIDTDKRILEHLFSDARHSTRQIAKALGIKQPSVHARIKKLEREEFIRQYDTLLATHLLPFIHKMYYCSLPREQLERIQRMIFCAGIQEVFGEYTHQLFMFFQNIEQLVAFEKTLPKRRLEQEITKSHRLYGKIFDTKCVPTKYTKREEQLELDPLDIKTMLIYVQGGARKTVTAIAKELGTTMAIVKYRKKKLIDNGYFLSFVAQPGPAFSSIKIAYHVFSLEKDIAISTIAQLPRCIIAYSGDKSLTVIQLSLFFDDYLTHSNALFRTLEPHLRNVQSFIVNRPILLNRYREELFLKKF